MKKTLASIMFLASISAFAGTYECGFCREWSSGSDGISYIFEKTYIADGGQRGDTTMEYFGYSLSDCDAKRNLEISSDQCVAPAQAQ